MPDTSGWPSASITQSRATAAALGHRCAAAWILRFVGADLVVGERREHLVEIARADLEGLEHLQRVLVHDREIALQPVARVDEMLVVGNRSGDREQHDGSTIDADQQQRAAAGWRFRAGVGRRRAQAGLSVAKTMERADRIVRRTGEAARHQSMATRLPRRSSSNGRWNSRRVPIGQVSRDLARALDGDELVAGAAFAAAPALVGIAPVISSLSTLRKDAAWANSLRLAIGGRGRRAAGLRRRRGSGRRRSRRRCWR